MRDFGQGMDAAQLAVVRTGAPTVSSPGTASESGLGIGLSLVQRLADRMGASVRLESSRGRGTIATVRFHGAAQSVAAASRSVGQAR